LAPRGRSNFLKNPFRRGLCIREPATASSLADPLEIIIDRIKGALRKRRRNLYEKFLETEFDWFRIDTVLVRGSRAKEESRRLHGGAVKRTGD